MAEIPVRSEISGAVWKVADKIGDRDDEATPLVILEAMKMEIPLLAPEAGVAKEVRVREGDPIAEGESGVILEWAERRGSRGRTPFSRRCGRRGGAPWKSPRPNACLPCGASRCRRGCGLARRIRSHRCLPAWPRLLR